MGRLGSAELAAVGLSGITFAFSAVVFNFLLYITTPAIAEAVAQEDRNKARPSPCAARKHQMHCNQANAPLCRGLLLAPEASSRANLTFEICNCRALSCCPLVSLADAGVATSLKCLCAGFLSDSSGLVGCSFCRYPIGSLHLVLFSLCGQQIAGSRS